MNRVADPVAKPGRPLRVGVAQIVLEMCNKPVNVEAIGHAVESAAAQNCDVVVLPECSLAGWLSPAARRAAESIPGPVVNVVGELARRRHIAVVLGLEEVAGGRLYNAAVFIDRAGRVVSTFRKINELELGLRVYDRGRTLNVFDFEGTWVGLDICADSWVPQITDTLYLMGAQVIFSPCAWAIEPGSERENSDWISAQYRERTSGKLLHLVAANSVGHITAGPWAGKVLHGDSMVFGPDGEKLAQAPTGRTAMLVADLIIPPHGQVAVNVCRGVEREGVPETPARSTTPVPTCQSGR